MATNPQNVDLLSKVADNYQYIAILLSLLLPIFTLVSYNYAKRAQNAKDIKVAQIQAKADTDVAQANKKSNEAKHNAAEANARSGEARKGAADANKQAGEANKQAAEANKQAAVAVSNAAEARTKQEEIQQENIKLSTRLNQSIADARSKQTELANAQRRELEARLELQQTLEKVRIAQLPRKLTAEQESQLLAVLQAGPKGTVYISFPNGNEEAHAFAIELTNLLAKSGWEAIGCTAVVSPVVYSGLWIQVKDVKTAPPYAGFLQKSLIGVGFPTGGQELSGIPEGRLELFVGNKPN